jgi:hypothetical protein
MPVILTSFKQSVHLREKYPQIEWYSVSRFQPAGFHYDTLEFLGAYDVNGDRLHLQGREDPLNGYKTDLFRYYIKNWGWIEKWLESLDNDVMMGLCCWCPYSNSTRIQIKKHGSFACHTGLRGKIINKYRPDIDVLMDDDRHKRLVDEWKPIKYNLI